MAKILVAIFANYWIKKFKTLDENVKTFTKISMIWSHSNAAGVAMSPHKNMALVGLST